jgi:hypothetical protein
MQEHRRNGQIAKWSNGQIEKGARNRAPLFDHLAI